MSKAEITPEFLNKMHMAFYSAIASAMTATNSTTTDGVRATENCLRRMLIEVYDLTVDEANEMIADIN